MHVYTYEFLTLQLWLPNNSARLRAGECFPIVPREEYSTENRTQLPSLPIQKIEMFLSILYPI